MGYKSIYAYPWDLAVAGVAGAVSRFAALGLDTITVAGSYHAGKFLRPHGAAGKVYFPEDGVVYFKPDPSRYGAIKPVPHSTLAAEATCCARSPLRTGWRSTSGSSCCTTRASARRIRISAVTNAFGDRYIYSLCPSSPEARAYARGVAPHVTESYPVVGVSLETPGFLPYPHGFHHEFALVRPNRWLELLQLGLCFCEHCLSGETVGIFASRRCGDRSPPTSRRTWRATSTFLPTWPRRSGSPTRAPTAIWQRSSTGAARS